MVCVHFLPCTFSIPAISSNGNDHSRYYQAVCRKGIQSSEQLAAITYTTCQRTCQHELGCVRHLYLHVWVTSFFILSADAALGAYSKLLADGVVLSPSLLSRFLNLCRQQTTPLQNPFIQLHKVAREVMQMIRDTQGLCSFDNYHAMLDILVTTKQPVE